ncbi:MAG: helix-turn-helix domain-containing protein [Microbacteriaceae bacterium]
MTAAGSAPVAADGVGAAVRSLRLRRRLSARALARLAGVSQPLLSKIENGVTLPSVLSLYAIAEALGVGPADLLPAGDDPAVPTSHGMPLPAAEAGTEEAGTEEVVRTLLLHAAPGRRIEVYRVEHPAGHRDEAPFQHSGEDVIHVLEGRATLRCGRTRIALGAGDTAWIDATTPHRFATPRDTGVVALIVTVR